MESDAEPMPDNHSREFDVVIFGATGYSGAVTARYLAEHAPPGMTIALAGRSLTKLEQLRATLPSRAGSWPLIIAEVDTPSTLDAMAARTRVVLTTVGPWMRYGENVVAAAVNAGCHYLDLTAEPPFVRWTIDKFHEQAAANGSRIVNSVGFDSVPSDLPVYLLHRTVSDDNEGTLTDTTMVLRKIVGWVSGGSVDTGRVFAEHAFKPGFLRLMLNRESLTDSPGTDAAPRAKQPFDIRVVRGKSVDPTVKGTLAPFIAGMYNTRVVRRSNALLGGAYGPGFRYQETLGLIRLPVVSAVAAGVVTLGYAIGLSAFALPPVRRLLDVVLPKPGNGPGQLVKNNGALTCETYSRTTTGARYKAVFHSDYDPGYEMTAVIIGEAAIALIEDSDRLPAIAGVLTPAAAFGDVLVERLRTAGITLECRRLA